MRRQKGFSLIELLIVVAIILIIAAIAVPSLMRSRMLANESAAASTVRTLNTAQATYASTYPGTGYAIAIANLGSAGPCVGPSSLAACLVDPLLTAGAKGGYNYASNGLIVAGSPTNTDFATSANPQNIGISGNKDFCSTSDMIIHFVVPGTATVYTPVACQALQALQN